MRGCGCRTGPGSRPLAESGSTTSSPRRRRCGRSRSRALPNELPPARRVEAAAGAGVGGTACWCSASSRHHPVESRCGWPSASPGPRRHPDHRRRRAEAPPGPGGDGVARGHGRRRGDARSCGRPTCATGWCMGVLVETFETAITWDRFEDLHAERNGGGADAVNEVCGGPMARAPPVTCRFTHVYPDGPAPYFTVIAPAAAAARSSNGTRSRPPPRRR